MYRLLFAVIVTGLLFTTQATTGTCGSTQFSTCGSVCCTAWHDNAVTTIAPGDASISSCCRDNATTCPGGADWQCCAITASATYQKAWQGRSCYNSKFMGCCQYKWINGTITEGDTVKLTYDYGVVTYDKDREQCCSNGISAVLVSNDFEGVVDKGDTCGAKVTTINIGAANEARGSLSERARCITNSDCPTSTTCCIRKANTNPEEKEATRFGSDPDNTLGYCIDSTLKCCGGLDTADIVYEFKNDTFAVYQPHKVYDPNYETCCKLDRTVISKRAGSSRCSCKQDSECESFVGAGSKCCFANSTSASLLSLLTCTEECRAGDIQCKGRCTRPSNYEGQKESCLTCGKIADIETEGHIKCCSHDSHFSSRLPSLEYEFYDARVEFCCPAGVWNGALPVIGRVTNTATQRCGCKTTSDCPSGQSCCGGHRSNESPVGVCIYDGVEACCDKSYLPSVQLMIYKPETQVCCAVNGVQNSINSCPCSSDSQCPHDGACCVDHQALNWGSDGESNFPYDRRFGSDEDCQNEKAHLCHGKCINKKYETCCDNKYIAEGGQNVNVCQNKWQTCCEDGSCCRKGLETCKKGDLRTRDLDSETDYLHLWEHVDEHRKTCTSTEYATVSINFVAYGFPAVLTVVAVLVLLLGVQQVLTGENSTFKEPGKKVKVLVLLILCLLTSLLGVLLLWAPTWKYGIATVVTNSAILACVGLGRLERWQKIFINVLAVASVLYLIDPFANNSVLSFGSGWGSGSSILNGLQNVAMINSRRTISSGHAYTNPEFCTGFYGFFKRDTQLYDNVRQKSMLELNPSFGPCRYDWTHAISVFAGILIAIHIFVVTFGLLLLNRDDVVYANRPKDASSKIHPTIPEQQQPAAASAA